MKDILHLILTITQKGKILRIRKDFRSTRKAIYEKILNKIKQRKMKMTARMSHQMLYINFLHPFQKDQIKLPMMMQFLLNLMIQNQTPIWVFQMKRRIKISGSIQNSLASKDKLEEISSMMKIKIRTINNQIKEIYPINR